MPIYMIIGSLLLLAGSGFCLYQAIQATREEKRTKEFYRSILKKLNAFFLLIDEDLVVHKTNYYLRKNEIDPEISKRVGELIRCRNGLDALRCGTHVLCPFCPVRTHIVQAFQENRNFQEIEVPIQIYQNDDKSEYSSEHITLSGNLIVIKKRKYMLLTLHSITTLKKVLFKLKEEKQHAQQSDRLKTAFLTHMNHEIRTPLTAITGFANLLHVAATKEECREYIDQITINSEVLLQMVNDLFDFSKLEAGSNKFVYSKVHVNQVFNALRYRFEHSQYLPEETQIIYETPEPDEFRIRTDYERILQVLTHLLSNAVKFTSPGLIATGYEVQKEELYCYVKDTGPGLCREEQKIVFDRFTKLRSHKSGNGLGLAICQTIIRKMQGRIGVSSEPGKGSTFWFTIPLHPHPSCYDEEVPG